MPTDMTGRRGAVTSSTGIGGVTLGVDDAITAPSRQCAREEAQMLPESAGERALRRVRRDSAFVSAAGCARTALTLRTDSAYLSLISSYQRSSPPIHTGGAHTGSRQPQAARRVQPDRDVAGLCSLGALLGSSLVLTLAVAAVECCGRRV